MAELQQLLQSIQQGKAPMPPGLLNIINRDQEPVPVANVPASDGSSNEGGNPSPEGCESGYASVTSDTPSGSKSQSPITSAQVPTAEKPSSVPQPTFQNQMSVQSVGSNHSPGYSASNSGDMPSVMDVYNEETNYHKTEFETKPSMNGPFMPMPTTFSGGLDNDSALNSPQKTDCSSPSLDNLNSMNEVLSNMKQEQLSPPSINRMNELNLYNNSQSPTQNEAEFIERRKQAIKQELMETHMSNLAYVKKSPSPEAPPLGGACNYPEKTEIKQFRSSAPPRTLGAVGNMIADARIPPKGEKQKLVESVSQTIIDAHMETCNWTREKVALGFKKYREIKESGKIPESFKAMMGGAMDMTSGANGMMGGPNGMMGGPNGMMGGANAMMGGANGIMDGQNGLVNGMNGMHNNMMNGMSAGMNGMANGPNGMMTPPNGMSGTPNGGPPDQGMISSMWSSFVKGMVPVITRVVNFSKRLPGFGELSQEDQIKLIKQGSFEVAFIRYTKLFDEEGMMVPSMDFKVPRPMMNKMPMGSFFTQQLEFALVFNPLDLDDAEIGLFTSIMIMNADRIGIDNKKAVSKLQGLFLQCLYHYMKKNRPDTYENLFLQTINMLPDLRDINESHAVQLNKMKMNLPELHAEVFHSDLSKNQ